MATDSDCTPCPDGSPCGAPTIVTAGKYAVVRTAQNCPEVLQSKASSLLSHGSGLLPVAWRDGSSGDPINLAQLQGQVGDSVLALMALKPNGDLQKLLGDPATGRQELVIEGSTIYIQPKNADGICYGDDVIPVATEEELGCTVKLGLTNCGPTKCLRQIPDMQQDLFLPAGSVVMFGGTSAPVNWVMCNGTPLDPVTEEELFEVIGYNFGRTGDLFLTPDFRGLFPRGVDNGKALDPDASSRVASATGGAIGDAIGSYQDHAFERHNRYTHVQHKKADAGFTPAPGISYVFDLDPLTKDSFNSGDPTHTRLLVDDYVDEGNIGLSDGETRPKNLNINFIISLGMP